MIEFSLYFIFPITYCFIAAYVHKKEWEGKRTFGHIVAMSMIFKMIGVVVATVITWIVIWVVV